MTLHAPIGFSKLPRVVKCPGSLSLEHKAPPEKSSAAAIEGGVAHWVAYQLYNGIRVPVGTERDGIKVDEDMLSAAELWCESIPKGGVAELPVTAPSIHPTDCWGTPDLWFWDEAQELLTITEYKYGYAIVDEFDNEQLIGQAAGVIDTMGFRPKRIKMVVVQPYGYVANKVRSWEIGMDEFPAYLKPIQDAVADSTTTRVGPHCLYCPAREICSTFQAGAAQVVQFFGSDEAIEMTPAQMGSELTVLSAASKILEARKSVLNAMVEDQLRKGRSVTGWEMKSRPLPLAWNVDGYEILSVGALIGVNLAKPAAPITPTQARDRKLIDEETLKGLASRPNPTMTLSPISTATTRRIFA